MTLCPCCSGGLILQQPCLVSERRTHTHRHRHTRTHPNTPKHTHTHDHLAPPGSHARPRLQGGQSLCTATAFAWRGEVQGKGLCRHVGGGEGCGGWPGPRRETGKSDVRRSRGGPSDDLGVGAQRCVSCQWPPGGAPNKPGRGRLVSGRPASVQRPQCLCHEPQAAALVPALQQPGLQAGPHVVRSSPHPGWRGHHQHSTRPPVASPSPSHAPELALPGGPAQEPLSRPCLFGARSQDCASGPSPPLHRRWRAEGCWHQGA